MLQFVLAARERAGSREQGSPALEHWLPVAPREKLPATGYRLGCLALDSGGGDRLLRVSALAADLPVHADHRVAGAAHQIVAVLLGEVRGLDGLAELHPDRAAADLEPV